MKALTCTPFVCTAIDGGLRKSSACTPFVFATVGMERKGIIILSRDSDETCRRESLISLMYSFITLFFPLWAI